MRSLQSDYAYFQFLDEARGEQTASPLTASLCLIREFPNLRREEAKAVFLDWRNMCRCYRADEASGPQPSS